jgi:hypothetical protein
MRFEASKESRSLGQSRKQLKPILFEPTIKLVLRAAFQSKQKSERDQLANGEFGLNMFRRFFEHIIYAAKKFCDKLFMSHGICFLCLKVWSPIQ